MEPEPAAAEASAFDDDDAWIGADPSAVAAAAATTADAAPVDAASVAEADAEFEAQASAAEQDATVEAVMDPAVDYDADDADGVHGVAPGQSLEDAVAAYEARLAAEELERQSTPRPSRSPRPRSRSSQPPSSRQADVDEAEVPSRLAARGRQALGRADEPEAVVEPEAVALAPEPEPSSPTRGRRRASRRAGPRPEPAGPRPSPSRAVAWPPSPSLSLRHRGRRRAGARRADVAASEATSHGPPRT